MGHKRDAGGAVPERPSAARIIIAACAGNAVEWYDIVLYSYLAVYIGKAFFPSSVPGVSLLLTFGTFAVSFLIRPIGSLVLGAYADSAGRKPALMWSLLLMVIGTLLLVATPSYHYIGVLAPILVLIGRLIQGFSAGGEFGSATTLMIEHLPKWKGFAASFQFSSQGLSTVLAAGVGAILTSTLNADQISSWGFRVAFLFGALVGPVGLYIRRQVPESPEVLQKSKVAQKEDTFDHANAEGTGANVEGTGSTCASAGRRSLWAPARDLLSAHLPLVILMLIVEGLGSSITYMVSYVPTYSIDTLGLASNVGFIAVILGGFLQVTFTPVAGFLSDKFGQATQMLVGAVLLGMVIYPLFSVLSAAPGLALLIVAVAVLIAFKAWYSGPSAALQGKVFPSSSRGIGVAFSYNCGVAIFGGITPFMATLLIKLTGDHKAPGYWLMFTALIAVISLIILKVRYRHT